MPSSFFFKTVQPNHGTCSLRFVRADAAQNHGILYSVFLDVAERKASHTLSS